MKKFRNIVFSAICLIALNSCAQLNQAAHTTNDAADLTVLSGEYCERAKKRDFRSEDIISHPRILLKKCYAMAFCREENFSIRVRVAKEIRKKKKCSVLKNFHPSCRACERVTFNYCNKWKEIKDISSQTNKILKIKARWASDADITTEEKRRFSMDTPDPLIKREALIV